MSSNLNYKQVANVKRRTWDVEAYEQKAKARADAEAQQKLDGGKSEYPGHHKKSATDEPAPKRFKTDEDDDDAKEEFKPADPGAAGPVGSQRAFLQPRRGKVDIDSRIGATEIISAEAAAKTSLHDKEEGGVSAKDGVTKSGVGWHCSVCDCFLKDSMTYLDHINGRKHQRKLGFSMRVERSTKDQMLGRLSQLTKEKERAEQQNSENILLAEDKHYEQVVKAKDEEEERGRAEKARKRRDKKKQKRDAPDEPPKKEENNDDGEEGEEEEVEEEGINPDLAAMMGFSGFK